MLEEKGGCVMQYNVYCLLKREKDDRIVRVKVFADCISDALAKAKEMFMKKIRKHKFSIFMYETADNV